MKIFANNFSLETFCYLKLIFHFFMTGVNDKWNNSLLAYVNYWKQSFNCFTTVKIRDTFTSRTMPRKFVCFFKVSNILLNGKENELYSFIFSIQRQLCNQLLVAIDFKDSFSKNKKISCRSITMSNFIWSKSHSSRKMLFIFQHYKRLLPCENRNSHIII